MIRRAEAQGVDQRYRASTHCEYVAQDPADTCRRALIRLDVGRVVVALHLENGGLPIANIDHACILAGALDDTGILRREFGQVTA